MQVAALIVVGEQAEVLALDVARELALVETLALDVARELGLVETLALGVAR